MAKLESRGISTFSHLRGVTAPGLGAPRATLIPQKKFSRVGKVHDARSAINHEILDTAAQFGKIVEELKTKDFSIFWLAV